MVDLLADVRVRVVDGAEHVERFGDQPSPARQREHAGRVRGARAAPSVTNCNRITNLPTAPAATMILHVQRHVHDTIADAVRRQFGLVGVAAVRCRGAAEPRARRSRGHGAPSSSRGRCAKHRAPSRRSSPDALGPLPGVDRVDVDAERLSSTCTSNGAVRRWREPAARLPRSAADEPRRPSSSTRPSIRTRRRTSATCATPRSATRSCACCASAARRSRSQNYIDDTGVQVADVIVGFRELEAADARRTSAASPTRRGSTTTAGICIRGSPSGTRTTRRGSPSAPRRSTISSMAATRPPRWARSSSSASSART